VPFPFRAYHHHLLLLLLRSRSVDLAADPLSFRKSGGRLFLLNSDRRLLVAFFDDGTFVPSIVPPSITAREVTKQEIKREKRKRKGVGKER
jgi:hypothetical protein